MVMDVRLFNTVYLLTIIPSPTATLSPSSANAGTYTNTFTVSDDCGNISSVYTQVITVNDNTDPVITCPNNVSIDCDDPFDPANTGTATATDNCDSAPNITHSDTTIGGSCPQSFTIQRTWTATDACGNSISCMQLISSQDVTPPVLIGMPANTTVPCDAIPPAPTVTATDNCDPTVIVIYNEIVNTVEDGCGEIIRTWDATDYCGNSVSKSQTITVEDTEAPSWLTAAGALDATVQCSDAAGLATAQTYEPVPADNCDPSLAPVKTSGSFVPGGCPQAGIYTNTWEVTDNCGNTSALYTQVITVIDNTAPVWNQAPNFLNRNLACADTTGLQTALALTPTATDNCGTDTIVMESDITTFGNCSGSYTKTRKWLATALYQDQDMVCCR